MKTLLIILLVPFSVAAQEYSEVVEVPGKSAKQLYTDGRAWFAITFVAANSVLQMDDPEAGKLIGKGYCELVYLLKKVPVPLDIYFTLSIQVRDGRYKYEIYSTDIKTRGGETYTYELMQTLTTEEGLKKYYEQKNVKGWMYNQKQFENNLENNRLIVIAVEERVQHLIADLKTAMAKIVEDW